MEYFMDTPFIVLIAGPVRTNPVNPQGGEHGSEYPLCAFSSQRPFVVSPAFHIIPEAGERLLDHLATWPKALVAKRLIPLRLLSPCPDLTMDAAFPLRIEKSPCMSHPVAGCTDSCWR